MGGFDGTQILLESFRYLKGRIETYWLPFSGNLIVARNSSSNEMPFSTVEVESLNFSISNLVPWAIDEICFEMLWIGLLSSSFLAATTVLCIAS